MDKKKLSMAKTHATFGVISMLAGITLIFMGKTFIGISGAIVGAGLAIKGFKTIKESKNGQGNVPG